MNKCAKCGTEFEGKFCPECGTAVSGKPICPRCGNELNEGVKFCPNCGCNINEQVRSTTNTATVAVNFNWRKLLPYVPVALFVLWAVLLWAFFASTVVNGDGFFVNKVNLYQMFKDDMMSDLYSSGHALVALAVIANVYAVVLALLQFRRSARVSNIGAYASFIFYVAIIICGGVFAGKRNEFTEGFDEYNGVLPAVVISLTAVFALLQAGAMALGKFFGDKERSTQTSASQRERKPVQTPKFIVNTGKWVRAHKALTALLSITIVVTIVLCTVLPVTLGNIFRIGKVNQIKLGDTYDQVEAVLGKPYAQASDDRQYNYYSKNATKIMDQLYELSEQQDGITNFDKLEKLMAQMEKLNDQLKILDYEQITVNFANGKVSNLTLDKHVGKFDEKKVDKIYLGVKSGLLSSGYTVDLVNVANDQIDEHIEFTDGSYSLGVVSNVAFSDVKFGSGNYYGRSKYPTSATLSWTNQYGEQSQSVQLDSSNIDFEYSVSSSELKLSGTILSRSFYELFGMDLPWEGDWITSIHFDETVNYIPDIDELLTDTSGLVSIDVDSDNQYYSSQEGILFNKDKSELLYMPPRNVSLLDTDWYNAQPDGLIYVDSTLWTYKGTMPSNCQLTIRHGTTTIRANAFENQVNLTSVIIPNSVLTVGENAFYGCSSLPEIIIPSSVRSIGENAFYGCSSLPEIIIPSSVRSIGENAFKGCSGLTIYCEVANIPFWWISGWNGSCPVVWNCLHNDVATDGYIYTVVGDVRYALKDNEATVVRNAYSGSVTIPSSVEYKGKNYTITSIDSDAFDGCDGLTIYCEVAEKPSGWSYEWNGSCPVVWDYLNNDIATDGNIYTVVDGVRYILKDNEAIVARNAYEGSVIIPSSVEYKSKNYVVTSIADRAFYNCSRLQEITIPASVTSIGSGAFSGCSSLNRVYITNIDAWCNIDFGGSSENPLSNGAELYCDDEPVTRVTIPAEMMQVKPYIFCNCTSLQEITIPASVRFIGYDAFYGCSNLKTVTFAEGSLLQTIGSYAFSDCSSLQKITIPASVTSIGECAFEDCRGLQEITIPASVTSIGSSAFENCSSLTIYCEVAEKPSKWSNSWNYDSCPVVWNCLHNDVAIDGYIYTVVGDVRYALKDNEATVVHNAYSGSVTIPSSVEYKGKNYAVTSIGDRAFYNCSRLQEITISASVTSIGEYAFYYCSRLQEITIPANVASIGELAFYRCSSLQEITIPASVTSIGDWAFDYYSSLKAVYYGGTSTQWENIQIGDDNYNLTGATRYYYSAQKPSSNVGSYWRYVDGKPTIWKEEDQ